MKYIYPYECEKYGFSSPCELQSAIDGNRREGKRPGYGYDIPSPGLSHFYGYVYNPEARGSRVLVRETFLKQQPSSKRVPESR